MENLKNRKKRIRKGEIEREQGRKRGRKKKTEIRMQKISGEREREIERAKNPDSGI